MTMPLAFRLIAFLTAVWLAAPGLSAQDDDVLPKKGVGQPQLPLENPRTQVMKDKLVGWLKEHATVAALPKHAAEAFDAYTVKSDTFRYALGAELTDVGEPFLIECWDNRLYFHTLNADQAKTLKIGPRSAISYAPTYKQRTRRVATPLAKLEALGITGGNEVTNSAPIKGRVTIATNKLPPGGYTIRMSYRLGTTMVEAINHADTVPAAGGKIVFSFSAINRSDEKTNRFTGPLPVYVDICKLSKSPNGGIDDLTIYSNTLTLLLDVVEGEN